PVAQCTARQSGAESHRAGQYRERYAEASELRTADHERRRPQAGQPEQRDNRRDDSEPGSNQIHSQQADEGEAGDPLGVKKEAGGWTEVERWEAAADPDGQRTAPQQTGTSKPGERERDFTPQVNPEERDRAAD